MPLSNSRKLPRGKSPVIFCINNYYVWKTWEEGVRLTQFQSPVLIFGHQYRATPTAPPGRRWSPGAKDSADQNE